MGIKELKQQYLEARERRERKHRKVIELRVTSGSLDKKYSELDAAANGGVTEEMGRVAFDAYRTYRQLGIAEHELKEAEAEEERCCAAYQSAVGDPI